MNFHRIAAPAFLIVPTGAPINESPDMPAAAIGILAMLGTIEEHADCSSAPDFARTLAEFDDDQIRSGFMKGATSPAAPAPAIRIMYTGRRSVPVFDEPAKVLRTPDERNVRL